jgi:hypothetical protein
MATPSTLAEAGRYAALANSVRPSPTASLQVREYAGRLFYEAVFRHDGRQVKRRVGPARIEDGPDGWQRRRGRVPEGHFDERRAHVAAAGIVGEYLAEAEHREQVERERASAGATFREIAGLHALARGRSRREAVEPARPRKRAGGAGDPLPACEGKLSGHVMAALGDRPASKITTREINKLLGKVSASGASASTVNKYRATIVSILNYGMRESTYDLPTNPALATDKRGAPQEPPLVFYSPEEVEALSRSLAKGNHRALAEEKHQDNPEGAPSRWPRTPRTHSWCVWLGARDCVSASCSRCAGATSTSQVMR